MLLSLDARQAPPGTTLVLLTRRTNIWKRNHLSVVSTTALAKGRLSA